MLGSTLPYRVPSYGRLMLYVGEKAAFNCSS